MRKFIYGVLVVVGLLFIAGVLSIVSGEAPVVTEFKEKIAQTKAQVKSADLKDTVLSLLTNTNAVVSDTNVPPIIASLPIFVSEGFTNTIWYVASVGEQDRPAGLAYSCGSGFGHWGVVICPYGNAEAFTNQFHAWVFPWENGVFFYMQK